MLQCTWVLCCGVSCCMLHCTAHRHCNPYKNYSKASLSTPCAHCVGISMTKPFVYNDISPTPALESLSNPLQLGLLKIVCTKLHIAHVIFSIYNLFPKYIFRMLCHLLYLANSCSNCSTTVSSTICNCIPITIGELAIKRFNLAVIKMSC